MALSKSQIKKIEKHSDKYCVIVPYGKLEREFMYEYKTFYSKHNNLRTFIIDKNEYNNITKRNDVEYTIYAPNFDYNDVDDIGNKITKHGISFNKYFQKILKVCYGEITFVDRNYLQL